MCSPSLIVFSIWGSRIKVLLLDDQPHLEFRRWWKLVLLFQIILVHTECPQLGLGSLPFLVVPSLLLPHDPSVFSKVPSFFLLASVPLNRLGARGGGSAMCVLGPAWRGEGMKRSGCLQVFWEHNSVILFCKMSWSLSPAFQRLSSITLWPGSLKEDGFAPSSRKGVWRQRKSHPVTLSQN